MAIFSKVYKHDNFQSHLSNHISLPVFKGFNEILLDVNLFFESKSPDIATLCETKLDDLNECSNFSVRAYLPLI